MSHIITMHENQPTVSHRVIAEGTGNQAENIKKLIDTHKLDFEEFGLVSFETKKGNGRPTITYFLNEQQTTLLMTYLRNSSLVRAFKVALVKEFYKMREELYSKQPEITITNTTDQERIGTLETQLYMMKNENRELRRAMNRISYNDEELPKIEGAYQRKYGDKGVVAVTDVKGSPAEGIKVQVAGEKATAYINLQDFYKMFKEVKSIELKLVN